MERNFNKEGKWIVTEDTYNKEEPSIVYYRKEFEYNGDLEEAIIQISADSRYRLYVNGQSVCKGPCKGDDKIWYYDEVSVKSLLEKGINVIAVSVIHYPLNKANRSVWRTINPGLYVSLSIKDKLSGQIDIISDDSWKSYYQKDIIFHSREGFDPLNIGEVAKGNYEVANWNKTNYNDDNWSGVIAKDNYFVKKGISPFNIKERPIPMLYEIEKNFSKVMCVRNSDTSKNEWDSFIHGSAITIPANTKQVVEIATDVLENAYLKLQFIEGAGSNIKIISSESYVYTNPLKYEDKSKLGNAPIYPIKKDRLDYTNGHIEGNEDQYLVSGYGTISNPEEYEPFWYRTFRFIRLEIVTKDQPLTIKEFRYFETGYPLEVKTKVETSDESMKKIWNISELSLRRCMHETYMDCPFYEQLQYLQDSRSEILFTYNVAADDRLARQCIDDFARSQRHDGIMNAAYPTISPTLIPNFSIYFILMIYDHMMYFGDKNLVEKYMPNIMKIFQFYEGITLENGLVNRTSEGGKGNPYWSFVDWVEEWDAGVPTAIEHGPITFDSLIYCMGLQVASKLAEYIGYTDISRKWLNRAQRLQESILDLCQDEDCVLRDGPNVKLYSQHVQVFAVLTDTINGENAKKIIERSLNEDKFSKCSVSMAYYLFRAMEKTYLYDKTNQVWDKWRDMIKENVTTCVENDVDKRSDCHAWGAIALYELPAITLGVRPAAPGYEEISINPIPGYMKWAKGEVITPKGIVKVEWELDESGEIIIDTQLPKSLRNKEYLN